MDLMDQMMSMGRDIEESSFDIIDREVCKLLGKLPAYVPEEWDIVRRAIHTTGDLDFSHSFHFSHDALVSGLHALHHGCSIITDVSIIKAGISKTRLHTFGNTVHCFVADDDVINQAKAIGDTHSIMAMRKARDRGFLDGGIVGIGGSCTALFEILRMLRNEEIQPALVIGLPAGFVAAEKSKAALHLTPSVPFITSLGRKGGASIVISTIHSLLIQACHYSRAFIS